MSMLLIVLEHGGQWEVLSRVFHMKGPTFERLATRFASLISRNIYQKFVTELTQNCNMKSLQDIRCMFQKFPEALYAVDVIFQQCYRPSGSLAEGKMYFSGKHRFKGFKIEASVHPNGLAIGASDHYPGSISDFEIMLRLRQWNENR